MALLCTAWGLSVTMDPHPTRFLLAEVLLAEGDRAQPTESKNPPDQKKRKTEHGTDQHWKQENHLTTRIRQLCIQWALTPLFLKCVSSEKFWNLVKPVTEKTRVKKDNGMLLDPWVEVCFYLICLSLLLSLSPPPSFLFLSASLSHIYEVLLTSADGLICTLTWVEASLQ